MQFLFYFIFFCVFSVTNLLFPSQAENDLRSLVQVTSISKSVAQQALTRSKGSISRALRGELCKIQLNHQLLQDLARQ